jgi:hypothetical protein
MLGSTRGSPDRHDQVDGPDLEAKSGGVTPTMVIGRAVDRDSGADRGGAAAEALLQNR